jgi:hypothetical protein
MDFFDEEFIQECEPAPEKPIHGWLTKFVYLYKASYRETYRWTFRFANSSFKNHEHAMYENPKHKIGHISLAVEQAWDQAPKTKMFVAKGQSVEELNGVWCRIDGLESRGQMYYNYMESLSQKQCEKLIKKQQAMIESGELSRRPNYGK